VDNLSKVENVNLKKRTIICLKMANTMLTQNELLLNNLLAFFENEDYLDRLIDIITGQSKISLRIVDWFATNFSKKNYTVYDVVDKRFKVYVDYKLKLKAYSKKRFDPFCRWDRINIPYRDNTMIETTIGQLNFFKWILENKIIDYIESNYEIIENDMNNRNSISKKQQPVLNGNVRTRKKREELSVSAIKSIKKENIPIKISFS
jgi:hypothetical protein